MSQRRSYRKVKAPINKTKHKSQKLDQLRRKLHFRPSHSSSFNGAHVALDLAPAPIVISGDRPESVRQAGRDLTGHFVQLALNWYRTSLEGPFSYPLEELISTLSLAFGFNLYECESIYKQVRTKLEVKQEKRE